MIRQTIDRSGRCAERGYHFATDATVAKVGDEMMVVPTTCFDCHKVLHPNDQRSMVP